MGETAQLGDYSWRSVCGQCFRLKPVPLQSLSELERVRLQEVAFLRLLQDHSLGHVSIPKDTQRKKRMLRRKLEYLGRDKKESVPQAFSVPLQQVIFNDRWLKLRQDSSANLTSLLLLEPRANQRLFYSSNSSLNSPSTTPGTPEGVSHTRRRGGMSVDCITDLDDGQSRLLEALQLSLPADSLNKKEKKDKKLSLNPIYRQVPRVLDLCCQHLERYGLQTVGIFRVGGSRRRVRQLREEFDRGVEVTLGAEHSVHDVAGLLKEFLRDLPDPLLTRELYTAFINCTGLGSSEQISVLRLLICLLPACNCDTLQRLLLFLSTVASHAEDSLDSQGEQVVGNKMTALNLATIFGPNILHKQKSSEKEFSVQSSARAEESAAVISIVQNIIAAQHTLFMIPAELQHNVLLSLMETDGDVVDYLLRRRASLSQDVAEPDGEDLPGSGERRSSSDSNRAQSGEISPYENNSPVFQWQPVGSTLPSPEREPSAGNIRVPTPPPLTHTDGAVGDGGRMWGTWHATLKTGYYHHLQTHTGSTGSLSDSVISGSSEALHDCNRNVKSPVRKTLTSLADTENKPHPPVTRAHSSPESDSPLNQSGHGMTSPWQQHSAGTNQSEESRLAPPTTSSLSVRPLPLFPGLKKTHTPETPRSHPPHSQGAASLHSDLTEDWQRETWQIWQFLSSESVDSLPETLV
ncbi:rho GTPase-activating protein 6-like isoform X2 [Hoplias malabaricus]|uniref:rho GTPase-activating protein 6-like isoform X2 n=1 Tax=Hoplias malabaricus TaxID=27720 RepID=UPI003462FAC1